MRNLTKHEAAAMWHFHDRYSAQNLSAIDFWLTLPAREQQFIRDMVAAIERASKGQP